MRGRAQAAAGGLRLATARPSPGTTVANGCERCDSKAAFEDAAGEVYVVMASGRVNRIAPSS